MSDEHVLDLAATASREALYAALQAAQLVIVELAGSAGRLDQLAAFEAPVRRALRVGSTIGSPADLAARAAGDQTGHGDVAEALRRPAGCVVRDEHPPHGKCPGYEASGSHRLVPSERHGCEFEVGIGGALCGQPADSAVHQGWSTPLWT